MPICAKVAGFANNIAVVDPVRDANGVIVGSAVGTDYSKCEIVALTGADYHLLGGGSTWHQLGNLSIDNAHVIGLAVGLVWATAFIFRLLARAIFDPLQNESSES